MKIDLTRKLPPSLKIVHEPTGNEFRFEFHKIFTRQQRAMLQKTVGKGINQREVTDLRRMFRDGIKSIEGVEVEGQPPVIVDPEVIVQIMDMPENMGGLPEDVVAQVVQHVLGSSTLQEEPGNG